MRLPTYRCYAISERMPMSASGHSLTTRSGPVSIVVRFAPRATVQGTGPRGRTARKIISTALDRTISLGYISVIPPRDRGVSAQASSDTGRGAVAGEGVGDAARFSSPAVQAASSRRASRAPLGPLTGGGRRPGQKCSARVPGPQRWIDVRSRKGGRLTNGTTTGGGAEQTYKHRARDATEKADLR